MFAVDGVSFYDSRRRDARPGRRIRLRQIHRRPHHFAADRADRRQHQDRRPRHHAFEQDRAAALSPADADHLPGSVFLARSAHVGRRHRGRADARAWHRARRRREKARGRIVRSRGPAQGADGQLSAPVFGRAAPAHRYCPRSRAAAEADRRRRAGVRARRLDPGAGAQSDDGPAARDGARVSVHLAQSGGGRAHQPPHRGDVSRPHRRIHRQAHAVHARPLHPTPSRCCWRCRCPTRASSGRSACCRATCRARSIRRAAATSTPAAPMSSTAAGRKPHCSARSNRARWWRATCASGNPWFQK